MSDYKSLFKAAKAQRESAGPGKLSKEQIRALKAQKAAAAAKSAQDESNKREKQGAARAAAAAAPPQGMMPPPAPRPAKPSKPVPPPPKFSDPVPFRAESQATLITSGTGGTPSSDGSFKGKAVGIATASLDAQPSAGTNGSALPSGFFEEAASSAASSVEAAESQSGLPSGFFEAVPGQSAGDVEDVEPSVSGRDGPSAAVPSTLGRVDGSLPGDFFEDTGPEATEAEAAPPDMAAGTGTSDQVQPDGSSALPKGFFANADADAKARGEAPVKPRSKDEQFSDFMSSIAADVKEVQAREEEEAASEAAERAERELFEQQMRLKRIEELKGGAPSSSTAGTAAETLGFAEVALDISSIAEAPVQPRKRRRLNVLEPDLDEDADEEDSESEDLMLDWRAKTV